jgi:hypothetical protein
MDSIRKHEKSPEKELSSFEGTDSMSEKPLLLIPKEKQTKQNMMYFDYANQDPKNFTPKAQNAIKELVDILISWRDAPLVKKFDGSMTMYEIDNYFDWYQSDNLQMEKFKISKLINHTSSKTGYQRGQSFNTDTSYSKLPKYHE